MNIVTHILIVIVVVQAVGSIIKGEDTIPQKIIMLIINKKSIVRAVENYSIEAFLIAPVNSWILDFTSSTSSTTVPVTMMSPPAFAAM